MGILLFFAFWGMKQKLAVAQVIMEDPKVLILDEAFNGIESETVEKISKKLIKLKKEGKIIILTSHYENEIASLSDVIYKFDGGKVIVIK